jgi:RNA recognition motif-containing protein
VGNLPYQASEAELHNWFSQAGFNPDTVNIIMDRFSGQPRGFAFVEIADDAEGDRAVEACNGQEFLGRNLVVNEARPREEGSQRGGRPYGGGGNRQDRPRRGR